MRSWQRSQKQNVFQDEPVGLSERDTNCILSSPGSCDLCDSGPRDPRSIAKMRLSAVYSKVSYQEVFHSQEKETKYPLTPSTSKTGSKVPELGIRANFKKHLWAFQFLSTQIEIFHQSFALCKPEATCPGAHPSPSLRLRSKFFRPLATSKSLKISIFSN